MNKIQDAQIENKKVLLRVDFNVPMDGHEIEGDKRIREALPTIQYLLDHGASKIIMMTHLGKPDGKVDNDLSLYPIANRLAKLLKIEVNFDKPLSKYCLNDKITLLENIRFNAGEEANDPDFSKKLATRADLYVNDAFGTAHRAHASTVGATKFLPSYAGLLIQKEVENLEKLLATSAKPFTVILGGAKIEDKLPVIKNLMSRADNFLIGGAIANTFLAARRHNMGKSLVEPDSFKQANLIWQNLMDDSHKNLYLPKDLIISLSTEKAASVKEVKVSDLIDSTYEEYAAVDIGPATVESYKKVINRSKTLFWNGNMGISEVRRFSESTIEIAKIIADFNGHAVIGGGDTVTAVEKFEKKKENVFLSTGGGATLEYLAGKKLPGIKALE